MTISPARIRVIRVRLVGGMVPMAYMVQLDGRTVASRLHPYSEADALEAARASQEPPRTVRPLDYAGYNVGPKRGRKTNAERARIAQQGDSDGEE